uniref:KIB1-4 beta-propeller domain-containing protein n=1 Tax=Oryza barthii TaxID=65489 RepID=A0A0D3FSE5_9ORYZ
MRAPPPSPSPAVARTGFSELQPDLVGEIHGRLSFLDRLAFVAVSSAASRDALKPEPPWLVLPGDTPETATVFSLADRRTATVRASDPAMRGHVIIGSSGSWIVTADERGRMRLANPVTGEQGELPAITTIPFRGRMRLANPVTGEQGELPAITTIPFVNATSPGGHHFIMDMEPFVHIRYRGDHESWPHPYGTFTHTAEDIRLWFYRKVVLSASPRPGDYAAMLLLDSYFGAPAFATAGDGRWRVAPSRDGVEDAIHHGGKFLSVTYTGTVEAWERRGGDDGEFTSENTNGGGVKKGYFEVQVFDEMTQRWEAAEDIGELAILVGVNSSVCVSTAKHPELKGGCVYYTDDEIGKAWLRREYGYSNSKPSVGVYSLKDGNVMSIPGLGEHLSWPPPAWFTPSFR